MFHFNPHRTPLASSPLFSTHPKTVSMVLLSGVIIVKTIPVYSFAVSTDPSLAVAVITVAVLRFRP